MLRIATATIVILLASLPTLAQPQTVRHIPSAQPPPVTAAKDAEIEALKKRVASLEQRLEAAWTWIPHLLSRVPGSTPFLDCSKGNYQEAVPWKNSHLIFLVACERIEPYLEGYRATFAVGNPHSASFTGLKGTVGYGEDDIDTLKQKVDFTSVEKLSAGSWTRIQVAIMPAAAKDVRRISMEFTLETASLR